MLPFRLAPAAATRLAGLVLLSFLVATWSVALHVYTGRAWAQQGDADLQDVQQEDQGAAPAGDSGGAPAKPEQPAPPKERLLQFYFRALGWFYTTAFLLISFTLVALVVMNILTLRRSAVVPLPLVEGFEAHLNEKRYQEAYDLAKNDESFLGHVLSAGLGKLSAGYAQAI